MHWWDRAAAAVRIDLTVTGRGKAVGLPDDSGAPEHLVYTERVGQITADLRIGADAPDVHALKANRDLSSPGVKRQGDGFILTAEKAR